MTTRAGRIVAYNAPDSQIEAFHKASACIVRGVMGARGTGKTGANLWEGIRGASTQNVSRTGVRRSRFLILRDTYRQLETTTIPSFKKWLGGVSKVYGQYPIKALTRIPSIQGDGSAIEMETVFLAMDGDNIIDNLQSFESSFAWVNEARGIENPAVINMVVASCGRYPSKDEEGCPNRFVVMDTNPPDETHWWYKAHIMDHPEGWAFFQQVPPLIYKYEGTRVTYSNNRDDYEPNPAATYARIQNAGYDYWLDQIPNATDQYIRTMVMGKYGTFLAGKAVFGPDVWTEDVIAKDIVNPAPGLTMVVGIDTSGMHPGAVFGQMRGGCLHIVAELHAKDTPFDEFLDAVLVPFVLGNFRSMPLVAVLDPSNPRQGVGGKTALQLCQARGITAVLAASNNFNRRIGAVTAFLMRRKALAISPICKMVIEGFRGKYHYKKVDASGITEAYKPVPEKDAYADVHDALQYLCLYHQVGRNDQKIVVPQRKVLFA